MPSHSSTWRVGPAATFEAEFLTPGPMGRVLAVGVRRQVGTMPGRHRVGWAMFVAGAVLFATSDVRASDPWVVAGSVTFGAA